MTGAALWLSFLIQTPAAADAAAPPAAPTEAVRLREAGQATMRKWIVCVVEGGKAQAAAGVAGDAAVAAAKAGCLAERAATGEAIAAAERAAGNPVTEDQLAGLLVQLDATIGAGAAIVVDPERARRAKKRR